MCLLAVESFTKCLRVRVIINGNSDVKLLILFWILEMSVSSILIIGDISGGGFEEGEGKEMRVEAGGEMKKYKE